MAREVGKSVEERQQKGAGHGFEPFSAEAKASLSRPSGPGDPVEAQMKKRRCRGVWGPGWASGDKPPGWRTGPTRGQNEKWLPRAWAL